MTAKTINILGTDYNIKTIRESDDKTLEGCDGYTDYTVKSIIIRDKSDDINNTDSLADLEYLTRKTVRHEIIHAFLCESGLILNSSGTNHWSTNEEMVDWIAVQFPKIHKVYAELDVL